MKYSPVIIVILAIMLAGAVSVCVVQKENITLLTEENEKLEQDNLHLTTEISEISKEVESLNSSNRSLRRQKTAYEEKAVKDLTRVENIAKKKSKLYEKLVNRDFRKTQNELRELVK